MQASSGASTWGSVLPSLMANPHINLFRPYEASGAGHEDRLTRAALLVMKLVPLAEDAFLRLVANVGLAEVGRGMFDTQTRRLVEAEGDAEAEIERIVSVFLSPDESRDDMNEFEVVLDERGQRIDGTIRYGDHLLIAVESKLYLGQSDRQARHLSPEGMSAGSVDPVHYLAWHDLLDIWLSLRDAGVLAPSEAGVLDDFFEMAEENFAGLLPFTTLARAGQNDDRVRRRLRAILEAATNITASDTRDPIISLDAHATSIERARLLRDGTDLTLAAWPAELKAQALWLYTQPSRVARLGSLEGEFELSPNAHLAYRWAAPPQRFWLETPFSVPEYLEFWSSEEGLSRIRQHSADEVRRELWPWLIQHGFASADDEANLESFLERAGGRGVTPRPGVQVVKAWDYDEAVRLDGSDGVLSRQVLNGLNEIMAALDEPLLPVGG